MDDFLKGNWLGKYEKQGQKSWLKRKKRKSGNFFGEVEKKLTRKGKSSEVNVTDEFLKGLDKGK